MHVHCPQIPCKQSSLMDSTCSLLHSSTHICRHCCHHSLVQLPIFLSFSTVATETLIGFFQCSVRYHWKKSNINVALILPRHGPRSSIDKHIEHSHTGPRLKNYIFTVTWNNSVTQTYLFYLWASLNVCQVSRELSIRGQPPTHGLRVELILQFIEVCCSVSRMVSIQIMFLLHELSVFKHNKSSYTFRLSVLWYMISLPHDIAYYAITSSVY